MPRQYTRKARKSRGNKSARKTRSRSGRRGGAWSVSGATSALSGMSNKDVMGIVGVIKDMSKEKPEWAGAWREWKRGFAGLQQTIPMADVIARCNQKGINME